MLLASDNVSAEIYATRVPLLEGAIDCVRAGHIPGGLKANREFAQCVVHYENEIGEVIKTLLFDPQTAGGLLIAIDSQCSDELQVALESAGAKATDIGQVLPRAHHLVSVSK
jgi:selenide, water dikinase